MSSPRRSVTARTDSEAATRVLGRIRRDPVWFCREILGVELWSKQREVIEAVRDNPAVAVRSSHGVGKTTVAGATVLWFLAAFGPEAAVVTTAPTWRQVKDLLWREIRKSAKRSGFFSGKLTETRLDLAEEWFAVGLSTNQPENFQGYHSPHLLFVVDEASGVKQPIFEAAEGFLTAAGARTLLIGNPTQVGGEFYQAFHSARALYRAIHLSAFDTPAFTGETVSGSVARTLPSREWVERMRLKYRIAEGDAQGGAGRRLHPVYEVRVLGQFPSQGERAVVPMFEVENAQARDLPYPDFAFGPEITDEQRALFEATWPSVFSCDVARFGDDETVIAHREGNRVRIIEVTQGQDTATTAATLFRLARENLHPLFGAPVVVVDDAGVGGGVTDSLRKLASEHAETPIRVVAFNGANAPSEQNKDEYPNARSELWFEFAEEWLPELDLDQDEDLLADLCAPEYDLDAKARRVVEPKSETKKRLGRSPDRADACMMAFCRAVGAAGRTGLPSGPPVPGGESKWRGMGQQSGRTRWR